MSTTAVASQRGRNFLSLALQIPNPHTSKSLRSTLHVLNRAKIEPQWKVKLRVNMNMNMRRMFLGPYDSDQAYILHVQ